jgi:hypothetical protein
MAKTTEHQPDAPKNLPYSRLSLVTGAVAPHAD